MIASVTRRLQDLLKAVVANDTNLCDGKANTIATCKDSVCVKGTRSSQEHIKGLLTYVDEISLKPRGSHSEFIILNHCEDNDLNKQNCISIIMELAHMAGNVAFLEHILQDNKHCPGSGFIMINLGVLFCDKVSYDKAEACFKIAKSWFEQEQQHLHTAVANLNLAILYKVLGQIQLARQFCNQTVDLICEHHFEQKICVDLFRLLRTLVFTIKELELQNDRAQEVLTKVIQLLARITHENTSSVHLTRWLMAMLLKESSGVKVPNEDVIKFFEALYAPLGQSDKGCFVDAGFLKAICTVARMLGDPNEAYTLLKKVKAHFLQAFGPKHCLVGLLLYQVGGFYLRTGNIEDAEIALKQGEEILISLFGRNHPTVASCQLSLGTCIINKGNRRHAFRLLNQAMTVFNKINPKHPQVAEILLKLAELYVEDGKKMAAQETVKQALDILESVCGDVCFKTAGGYYQAGGVLKMAGACPASVIGAVEKAIDILSSLGVGANHCDLQMCNGLLGVLQLSMGERKGAKEMFDKVHFCSDTNTSTFKPEDIITPFKLKSGGGLYFHFIACIVSIFNLVHLTTGDEHSKYFGKLVSLLKGCRMETPLLIDFGGQALFFMSYTMSLSWENAFLIMRSGTVQNASLSGESFDAHCNPKIFMYASSSVHENNKPVVLFFVSGCPQDMKAAKCVALAFKESVDMLFMQPKFRKIFAERRILSMELPLPNVSPLCMLIDCFPVVVEQKLLEMYGKYETGQSVVLDGPGSCIIQSPVHVSYHSFKFCDSRKANLAFSNVLSELPNHLDVALEQVSGSKSMACLLLEEPENSMLSVVRKKEWVLVKGRFPPGVQFTSLISNSLAKTLGRIVDSVSYLIEEKTSSLCCEETFVGCLLIEEEFSSIHGNMESESGSLCSLPSVSVESHSACDKSLNCKSTEVGWHGGDVSEEKSQEGISDLVSSESNHHFEIGICVSLLEVLLYKGNNKAVVEPNVAGHASNEDLNSSLLLPESTASLNSYGSLVYSNYTNDYLAKDDEGTEANSTEQETLLSDTECRLGQTSPLSTQASLVSSLQHRNQAVEVICNSSEECKSCFKGCLTSHKEGNLGHYMRSPTDERLSSCVYSRVDAVPIARNTTESVTPIQKLDESLVLDLSKGYNITSSQQVSRETVEEALLARNQILENQVLVMQHEVMELRCLVDLLEQQLKEAEVERVHTLGELGRLLFSEDKKKRNRVPLVSSGCGSFDDHEANQSCSVSASHFSTKSNERLLGGAAHRWQGFQQRLLEMAQSLSGQDLSCMKMMLKGRVSGFRLARIRDVSQLFEELLYREETPVHVIKELLAGIGRTDLLEKLGVLSCGISKEALEERTQNNQHLSEPTRIDHGWPLTSVPVNERGEDFIEPCSEEGNLQSYEEVESTQLRLRKLEDISDIAVSSDESSDATDILSSKSCHVTVDEESSHSWKWSADVLFTNGSCNAHVRSCESQLAAAADGGLVEGRLLDFKRLHSSENYSCDAGANWAEMQSSSNEHAPLCKCSKLPGEVTTDMISGEAIPMNSPLSEGDINRATDMLEGKELLIELDGSKPVQDNDLAFCSELQDPRDTESTQEHATRGGGQSTRGGEVSKKDGVSVPFPRLHDDWTPVTNTQRGTTGDATVDSKRKHGASGINSLDPEGTGRLDDLPYRMEDKLQSQFEASCTPGESAVAAPSNTSWALSASTDSNTRNVEEMFGVSTKTTRGNVEGRNDVCDTHARPTHSDSENISSLIATGEVFSDSISQCLRPKDSSIVGWRRCITNEKMASFRDGDPHNNVGTVPTTNNEGRCSGGAVISTTDSHSRIRVGSRPKKRSAAREQQIQGHHSPSDDHSHKKKSNTAALGVVSAFLARHSQDECLQRGRQHGVSEDCMQEDSSLEGAAYMEDTELRVMAVSDSAWPVAFVGEYQEASVNDTPSGMHISSLYEPRGGGDCSVVQNDRSGTQYHFSAEHSNLQFSKPLLNYRRGMNYSTVNNYLWNASNDFPAYLYGNDFAQSGISPVEGCGVDHYAPMNVFCGPGLSEPVMEGERNHIGINGPFFDAFARQDATIQPVHCIVGDDVYGVNETSSDTAFREVSGECSRRLPTNSFLSCATKRNPTYLESASTDVFLGHSPDWPNRVSDTRRTELVGSDRSSTRARRSLSPLQSHANQSAPNVITPSRTEIGTMTDHCVGSLLNRDSSAFSSDSPAPADTSLFALEQRVAEACALVERVLREREERDLAERDLERRETERREREAAKRREEEQHAIPGGQQWLCEHYQRHCRVRFPCCHQFYPCHRCHNSSSACPKDDKKASHATHMKCSKCEHEQEINDGSKMCCNCGEEMSAYFCPICKHFTGVDKNPYHCKKCGICRIHQDRSFHCEVCNVCLDKRLQGKHKCRPDSGHDECCICLEDAFGGCQILPCSHKVHRECAIAMIENGIRNCPICRHPLYTPASSS